MSTKGLFHTYLPFLAGLFAGLFFVLLKVTGNGLAFFPGDFIDARFNNYILEHGYLYLSGAYDEYWNAPFMFPEKDVVSYSDNLLGTVPFYALFRCTGSDVETSFQYWFLLMGILNYACAFLFLRSLFQNSTAAALGAFVFAFSLALHSQMGHAQTFPRFAIPLAVWALVQFIRTLKPMYFFTALLLWVYQLYCGIYLGLLLSILIVLILLVHFLFAWKHYVTVLRSPAWLGKMGLGVVVNLALLAPLMLPYLERAKQLGFYPYDSIHQSLPTLSSYFFSWNGSLCWDALRETCISYPAFWDHEIFAGGVATLSLIAAMLMTLHAIHRHYFSGLHKEADAGMILFTAGLFLFFVFMRFGSFSVYQLLYHVPGFGSMRALQRIINIELLFFGMALAYLYARFVHIRSWVASGLLFLAVLTCLTLDNYVQEGMSHRRSKVESTERIQRLCEQMNSLPKNSIVSYEPDTLMSSGMDYQLDAMMAAQRMGLKTMNGYSATSPGGYGDYWVHPNEQGRRIWLERKQVSDTNLVVIH